MAPRTKIESTSPATGGAANTTKAPRPSIEAAPQQAASASSAPKPKISVGSAQTAASTSASAPAKAQASAPKPKVSAPKPKIAQPAAAPAQEQATAVSADGGATSARSTVASYAEPAPQPQPNYDAQPNYGAQPNYDPQPNAGQGASANGQASEQPKQRKSVADVRQAATSWVHRTFPGHEHAFYGAIVALIVALLVFAIGFWRMLLIALIVLVGVAVGQVFDGDPKIINALRGLVTGNRDEQ